MNLAIIRAGSEHLAELGLLFSGYRHFYNQKVDRDAEGDYLAKRMAGDECVIFMAVQAGEAAGFVLLYPTYDSVMLSPVWVLHDLFVSVDHRRMGIGRQLMETAHDFCRHSGASRVDLATAVTNTVAQPFYESMGYERDEEFYSYSLNL